MYWQVTVYSSVCLYSIGALNRVMRTLASCMLFQSSYGGPPIATKSKLDWYKLWTSDAIFVIRHFCKETQGHRFTEKRKGVISESEPSLADLDSL